MANVIHTVKVVYGSYSGIVEVVCDENDELDVVKAKVKKQERLEFLPMAHFTIKILDTEHLD